MPASRPPKQTGVSVSPGDRQDARRRSPSRSAALTETVMVKAETPIMQAHERRAVVHDPDQLGREPADRQPQLHRARVAGPRRERRHRRPDSHRRRRRHQHHDGRRRRHGHRQQPPAAADERRVDRRSEGADLGLPGRVRPLERTADHRGHQERHQPLPRLGLRRRARLRLVLEQQGQQAQRQPEDDPEGKGLGLLDRRPDRQAGRQQQAVLLLQPGVLAAHRRQRRRSGSASRPRSSAAGDFSQTTDQNGALYNCIKNPALAGACTAADTDGCFRDGGVLGRIPAIGALSDRPEHPEAVPDAERQRRRASATTTRSPGRTRAS